MDEVLKELEACQETMRAQAEEIKALRTMLGLMTALLDDAYGQLKPDPASAAPVKRARGRPRKVIDDAWLVEAFDAMRAEFVDANPRMKPTDEEVLRWWFRREFVRAGVPLPRSFDRWRESKLKTLRNRLGDARNPIVVTSR